MALFEAIHSGRLFGPLVVHVVRGRLVIVPVVVEVLGGPRCIGFRGAVVAFGKFVQWTPP